MWNRAIMAIVMSENLPMNERPESFMGSMQDTMEILGDIVAPIDVRWDADAPQMNDPER